MRLLVASCTSSRSKERLSLPDLSRGSPGPTPSYFAAFLLVVAELPSDLRHDDAALQGGKVLGDTT